MRIAHARPDGRAEMARIALQVCDEVIGRLARGVGAVVTIRALADAALVIERGRRPNQRRMAHIALGGRCQMTRGLARRNLSVVTVGAGSGDIIVVDAHARPDRRHVAIGAQIV